MSAMVARSKCSASTVGGPMYPETHALENVPPRRLLSVPHIVDKQSIFVWPFIVKPLHALPIMKLSVKHPWSVPIPRLVYLMTKN